MLLIDGDAGRTRGFLFRLPATGSDRDKFLRLRDAPDSPLVTLACARTLPQGAEVKLVWGKGIAATTGVVDDATRRRSRSRCGRRFARRSRASASTRTRSAFRSCRSRFRSRRRSPRPDAQKIRLVDDAGKAYPAKLPKDAGEGIESVTFGPGLPEKTQFRIELPANLKDDAGRALVNARSFPLRVRTDENPPLAKFAADFGILERVLPDGEKPHAAGHRAQRRADAAGRACAHA